ncbi:plasmid mobilization relaxosome protein MobC [Natronohydrobacter thiooxidans]|uniref:plasmid mobilization relaxosome protein MobC n=1 Tax=Natronohydrobacter thiooxidans TaxID=87172 RepID=UPI0008FF3042|nr:plasmid mobilization relaxosome protein MobC [Natronohydrobacter thiooxidans]
MTTLNTNTVAEGAGKPRLTPAQRQAIAQARGRGIATKVLAVRYGVSVQTIRNIARGVQMARVQARSETATVTARVPVADIRAFDALIAQLGGDQRSTVLRAFIRHPAGYLGADAELAESIRELCRELSAIGSNLNQIARRLNDPRLLPEARELRRREVEVLRATHAAVTQSRDHLAVLIGAKARRRDAAFRAILGEALVGDMTPEVTHGR